MKTLIETNTKLSKYIFEESNQIILGETTVITPKFIIADLNQNNSQVITVASVPQDWAGNKYLYDNGQWTLNPEWQEPSVQENTINE